MNPYPWLELLGLHTCLTSVLKCGRRQGDEQRSDVLVRHVQQLACMLAVCTQSTLTVCSHGRHAWLLIPVIVPGWLSATSIDVLRKMLLWLCPCAVRIRPETEVFRHSEFAPTFTITCQLNHAHTQVIVTIILLTNLLMMHIQGPTQGSHQCQKNRAQF